MMLVVVIVAIIIVCAVAWLWLIAPGKGADFTEFRKYDYAHRGLHDKDSGVPENSEKAFTLAVDCGFGMEFDLQLTKDNYVVVHHDHSISRTCGEDRLVSEMDLGELRQHRLFGTDEKIPLFEDVLKIVDGRTPLIIELKGYNRADELCPRVMEILKNYKGLYCVESFDPRIVKWFKGNRPDIVRGQLMHHMESGVELTSTKRLSAFEAFAARNLMTNFLTRPHFEAYDFHGREIPSMAAVRGLFGMQEVSWTLRREEDFEKAKALGNLCIFEGFIPAKTEQAAKRSLKDVMNSNRSAVCQTVQTKQKSV